MLESILDYKCENFLNNKSYQAEANPPDNFKLT